MSPNMRSDLALAFISKTPTSLLFLGFHDWYYPLHWVICTMWKRRQLQPSQIKCTHPDADACLAVDWTRLVSSRISSNFRISGRVSIVSTDFSAFSFTLSTASSSAACEELRFFSAASAPTETSDGCLCTDSPPSATDVAPADLTDAFLLSVIHVRLLNWIHSLLISAHILHFSKEDLHEYWKKLKIFELTF